MRIRYLGPASKAKGFYLLKECLDDIWKERQDFVLDIHFNPIEKSDYMNIHERYNYDELNNIFDETDVLLVPSILYETFGFTALEGLSFGVPVIVSDTVGAQDILMDKFGIIVNNITKENLKKVFENLSFEDLKNMNQSIVNLFKVISIEDVSILIKNCVISVMRCKMDILISIIVPVYKVEQYLDRCINSLVNQTYRNLEIILVDDGSPDKCPILCDCWAKR